MGGDYEGALKGFTEALALVPDENKAVMHSNIGASCLFFLKFCLYLF